MKTRKLLKKIGRVLEGGEKDRGPDRESLEKLLRRLAEKEEDLKAKLAGEDDKKKAEKLERKIKLLRAQRKKGLETLEAFD
jgi:hypothetical protein